MEVQEGLEGLGRSRKVLSRLGKASGAPGRPFLAIYELFLVIFEGFLAIFGHFQPFLGYFSLGRARGAPGGPLRLWGSYRKHGGTSGELRDTSGSVRMASEGLQEAPRRSRGLKYPFYATFLGASWRLPEACRSLPESFRTFYELHEP